MNRVYLHHLCYQLLTAQLWSTGLTPCTLEMINTVLLIAILQTNNKHLSTFQGLQLSVRVAKKSGEEGAKFTSTFSAKGLKDKVMH